jgi:uncharacterized membrane protein
MYAWLKLLHVAAVVLFLGNIYTGLFWHVQAMRTRDPKLLAHTMEGIIRSDRLFTVPGVFLILAGGFAAAMVGKLPLLATPWILWSIVLFSVAGVVFMARVAPLQRRMLGVARAGETGTFDWDEYQRLTRSWEIWGAIALLTPIAALVLMVLKPTF